MHGRTEVVQILLAAGADVNARNSLGRTPLHAPNMGHAEVTQILLAAGGDHNARDNEGMTPLDLAKRFGQTTVVELMLQHASEPLTKSAAQGGPGVSVVHNNRAVTILSNSCRHSRLVQARVDAVQGRWKQACPKL
mmetsp:Transcript_32118/g.75421  ORF Transcript_32118/g.75421 Transcript_32118/m.75421 type:complete len:136 (+) Transcript_32118:274-681(+)